MLLWSFVKVFFLTLENSEIGNKSLQNQEWFCLVTEPTCSALNFG